MYISTVTTSLIISILSALLSLTTFILTYPKLKKETKGRLKIKAEVSGDKQKIKIRLANASFNRIIKILELEVYYGSMPDYKQLVLRVSLEPVTLTESDIFNYVINAELIKTGAKENNIIQKYYSILWLRVVTAVSGSPLEKISFPANYFHGAYDQKAEKYQATDELLGFPIMKPVYTTSYNIRTK